MALFIKKNGSLQQVAIGHEVNKPEQQKSVSLDLASGDQIVTPDNGQVLTQVLIKKPETLVAGNIKSGVNVAGVVGNYTGSVDYLVNRINNESMPYSYSNNDITRIRDYAFYYDYNITSFDSTSVTKIGQRSFQNATNLTTFSASNLTETSGYAFWYCSKLVNVNVPELVTASMYDFSSCTMLETISLPKLTKFSASMFSNCTNLKTISAPLATFGSNNYVFQNCSSLQAIDFPSVTGDVSNSIFYGCTSLVTANLANAKSLAMQMFYNCTSLTDVTLTKSDSICTLGNTNAFANIGHQVTIHVPSSLISSYQTATNWSTLYNNGDITFVAIQ